MPWLYKVLPCPTTRVFRKTASPTGHPGWAVRSYPGTKQQGHHQLEMLGNSTRPNFRPRPPRRLVSSPGSANQLSPVVTPRLQQERPLGRCPRSPPGQPGDHSAACFCAGGASGLVRPTLPESRSVSIRRSLQKQGGLGEGETCASAWMRGGERGLGNLLTCAARRLVRFARR